MRTGLARTGKRWLAKAIRLAALLLMVLVASAAYQTQPSGQGPDRVLSESRWMLRWWCCTLP